MKRSPHTTPALCSRRPRRRVPPGGRTLGDPNCDRALNRPPDSWRRHARLQVEEVFHPTPEVIVARLRQLLEHRTVPALEGGEVAVAADCLSIHTGMPRAAEITPRLRQAISAAGFRVAAPQVVATASRQRAPVSVVPTSRTCAVTGSASGIGAATRRSLEAAGHRVIGVDLRARRSSSTWPPPRAAMRWRPKCASCPAERSTPSSLARESAEQPRARSWSFASTTSVPRQR